MAQPQYLEMIDLIKFLDDPHRKPITEFIRCNALLLQSAYATPNGRWTRVGGWWDRTVEGMNVAVALYPILNARRPHPFSLSDALVVLFMRDVEKPWELEDIDGKKMHRINMMTKDEQHIFRMNIAKHWGIPLSGDQCQAIQYCNDDHCDYTPQEVASRLAVFAYLCDYWCAEGWPDYPLEKNDLWEGARRISYKRAPDGVNDEEYLAKYKANIETYVEIIVEASKNVSDDTSRKALEALKRLNRERGPEALEKLQPRRHDGFRKQ